jgi:flagellar hook-associated protein 2
MNLNMSALTRFNNYNSFINTSSSLYNKSNINTSGINSKTNNYNNNLNSINITSSYKDTYSKKLSELQTYTNDSKEFYSDFVDKFSDLKKSSNELKSNGSASVFKADKYGSDNTSVVSTTNTSSNDVTDYKVEVSQLATGKSVSYNELSSNGTELVKDGNITIDNGKNSYNFDANTENALNNKDAMNKIAEKVNKAAIGIKATVSEKDGKSALKFESITTGENSKLSVAFTNDLSPQISVKATQEGKNAKYKVNNVDYSSESNNVNLSNTVKASLNSVGKAEVSSNNVDSKKIIDAVKSFANDYNKVVDFLDENSSKSNKIKSLADSFTSTKDSSKSLSSIGITVESNGKLSVNENNLKDAIGKDYKNVKNILSGSSGTATETYNKVQNAMSNSKNLYPSYQFDSGDSSIYSVKNSNVIYSQYNSAFSGGLFLNSLI